MAATTPFTRSRAPVSNALTRERANIALTLAAVAIGVAVAVPEQTQDVILGFGGAAAAVLSLVQPLVGPALLVIAVPLGGLARGSSGDSSTDLSFGAAEIVI